MADKLRIGIVLSSTREGRLNDRVADFVKKAVNKDHEGVIIDPKDIDFSHANQLQNFRNSQDIPKHLKDLDETVRGCDAFVLVSAEYNWCAPTGITNILNNIQQSSVYWKPCGIVNYAYGNVGGAKCANNLRLISGALGMIPVPKQLLVPRAKATIDKDGTVNEENITHDLSTLQTLNENKNLNELPPWNDPRDVEFSQTNQLLNYRERLWKVPDYLKEMDKTIQSLDALVFVSPEYNWCIPPGLTNMMNNIPQSSCCWKPCTIVTYSQDQLGGVRCANDLRIFTGGLGMVPVPKQMYVPFANENIDEHGNSRNEKLCTELTNVLQDLYHVGYAFKSYKEKCPAPIWHPSV